ncbi:formate dehydrogenase accessory sulfurtransferase FdhD [Novosphingobium sp.]|uniref:formate dehydrogenase accessory sulfurtransferase FdhD n=1 Tax=Novosphingobium sp. TaxID=1874826 RepID=UPI00286E9D3C|nr:formate dehydrogenase accessory sulfurtransferase FdhD [Novosphingobium sp.]
MTACRSTYDGALVAEKRAIPIETPVAIEVNGVAYAVMMTSPCDLDDFVTGFLLAEGLAEASEIEEIVLHSADGGAGIVARTNLPAHRIAPVMERARRRLGDSSCGICGLESIDMALRPLTPLEPSTLPEPQAIAQALQSVRDAQLLGQATGATHAAAFCARNGALLVLREDVGRHNALDKVIGALARSGQSAADGFLVVTSRASYELVEKAVRARCPLLVVISAPTSLAVERARAAGLALAVIARDDSMLWVSGPALPPEQNSL